MRLREGLSTNTPSKSHLGDAETPGKTRRGRVFTRHSVQDAQIYGKAEPPRKVPPQPLILTGRCTYIQIQNITYTACEENGCDRAETMANLSTSA